MTIFDSTSGFEVKYVSDAAHVFYYNDEHHIQGASPVVMDKGHLVLYHSGKRVDELLEAGYRVRLRVDPRLSWKL